VPTLDRLLITQMKKLGAAPAAPVPALSFFPKGSAKERIEKLLEKKMTRWIQPLSSFRGGSMTLSPSNMRKLKADPNSLKPRTPIGKPTVPGCTNQ